MPNFCPNCGVPVAPTAPVCHGCRSPLADRGASVLDARALADATQEVRAGAVAAGDDPALPPLAGAAGGGWDPARHRASTPGGGRDRRRWWSQPHHRTFVAVAVCGVVLGAAVGLAFAVGNQGVEPNRAIPAARRHRRPVTPPTTVPVIPADQLAELAYLKQLEAVLQQSVAGRTVLVSTLRGAPSSCALAPAAASVLVHAVVQNRTNILNELGALPPAPNAEAQQVEQLLAAALHASSQADGEYEAWFVAAGQADPQSCSGSSSPAIALFWNSARASDSTASTMKTSFITAFNPVAARFGLPTWTELQF